ncbi:RDD family protein [Streptomyces genisteinicus]|uniref:RDD family protein n=1 Tax=Streptomyces genisteinicus TaxID=2768068 RepID=A0A7H0HSL0_9ACTN|nr:RDD family protein [Streptomyces genisteinicus]QNP63526.1 RDD family protein [Streptomyces genisteinicus]
MSNDQPPGTPPPDDDPFRKRPEGPTPPPDGSGAGGPPPGGGSSPYGSGGGSPYEPPPGGSPYDTPGGGAGAPGGPYGGGQQPPYGQDPYGGAYGGQDPLAGMPPLAPFGKRFLARLIDILIIAVPLALISLLLGGWDWTSDGGDDWEEITDQVNTGRQWLFTLISLVAYVGYDTLMTKKDGRTVGKRLMKLRVAMLNDGRTPDTSAALMRAVVLWVPALVCCYCVWWLVILITVVADKPYKQGLHDKAGKTVVVSAP